MKTPFRLVGILAAAALAFMAFAPICAYAADPTVGSYVQKATGNTLAGQGVGLIAPPTIPDTPAANVVGDVGAASFAGGCAVLTLPSGGGTYASTQAISNSATAGSVVPISCTVARYKGGPITVTRVKISTSNATITNGTIRVHLYLASPTSSNGNGGTYLTTLSGEFCKIDVVLDEVHSDGADGIGTPNIGSSCTRNVTAGDVVIYGLLEARAAYAWSAAQTITLFPEGFN